MHDFHRLGLDQSTLDNAAFMDKYLGQAVIKQIELTPLALSKWNKVSVDLFRQICEMMAVEMPTADHVVRGDVGTHGHAPACFGQLLMYFGVQFPNGVRRQFLGLTAEQKQGIVTFTVYIAGSSTDAGRADLVAKEDSDGLADGFEIQSMDQLAEFRSQALPVLKRMRSVISKTRLTDECGFLPVTCQAAWGKDRRNGDAPNQFWNYWNSLKQTMPASEVARMAQRLAENNHFRKQKIISLLEQYVPLETAFSMGLSEAA